MTKQIKVRVRGKSQLYIHNDIGNTAFYLKKKINERYDAGDTEGVVLEITACLTMIAFAVEARVNFLGYKLVNPWKERDPSWVKLETVCKLLGVAPDRATRPFLTLDRLKTFRDALAHGKPKEVTVDEEQVLTPEELDKVNYLETEVDAFLTRDFLNEAYDDAEGLWRDLLKRSGLDVMDTITQGDRHINLIGRVEDLAE